MKSVNPCYIQTIQIPSLFCPPTCSHKWPFTLRVAYYHHKLAFPLTNVHFHWESQSSCKSSKTKIGHKQRAKSRYAVCRKQRRACIVFRTEAGKRRTKRNGGIQRERKGDRFNVGRSVAGCEWLVTSKCCHVPSKTGLDKSLAGSRELVNQGGPWVVVENLRIRTSKKASEIGGHRLPSTCVSFLRPGGKVY